MSRLLRTCCILAGGISAALTCLTAGCGGEALPAVDVAALNAELAQEESRLADRLAALNPREVEEARRIVASALDEGELLVVGLPVENVDDRVALAAALAQFREGAAALAEAVTDAAQDERTARKDSVAELETLRKLRQRFAEEVEPGFPEWSGRVRETSAQLASWREQRLEKMEDRQYGTFPAFHAAASARYREWMVWVERAGTSGAVACGELRPAAQGAAERLAARAAVAIGARERVEDGIGKLRAMPVSQGLVATARREAVTVYNGTIRKAADAMGEMEKSTVECPEDVRKRAEILLKAAIDLEKTAKGVSGDIREQMDRGAGQAATAAARRAREVHEEVMAGADEFETVRDRLRKDWNPIGKQLQAAADAANEVQKMARTDEEALTRDVALIESLRRRIEEAEIENWCEHLVTFRYEAAGTLSVAEEELAGAGDAYAAAMTAAARKVARSGLGNLRTSLDQRPAPGYTRPEKKVERARSMIDGFLADMDSMTDEAFMAEYKKVSDSAGQLVDEIVDHTTWTPGTRHPDIPNIHASDKERTWSNDPGYEFVDPSPGSTNIIVRWKPGAWRQDHPHVTAGQTEGTWVPDPGYKARRNGDLDPVWTAGTRHPTKPHVFATSKEHTWDAEPGYWFVRPGTNCDLVVRWEPGRSHPDHPHVSAGTTEGTWVPNPGYKARWNGDLDPVWTHGTRHPTRPHIYAAVSNGENVWWADPGYTFVEPNSYNLDVRWEAGRRHPDHPNISSGQTEGTWVPDPGYKARWNGDLDPVWTAGTRHPTKPHVFATSTEHTWDADPGWKWVNPRSSDLSVKWTPGTPKPGAPHVHASDTEGQWTPDAGYRFRSMANDGDFSVEWVGR